MSHSSPLIQPLVDCRDTALAGGKAVNLGVLLRGGFVVPDGFVVTTATYRQWSQRHTEEIPQDLAGPILEAYRAMGSPPVAARSSATAEDMSDASMAGQYQTYLDISDEATLLARVRACWASLDSPRTRAYLAEHGIDMAQVAMAVVVQRLVRADVAGVLFCANPQTGSRNEMLIEAAWGLGEAVVSGLVQPDVLRLDRATGRVMQSKIADKRVMILPGRHEPILVEDARRNAPCLKGPEVQALWKLGQKAAEHFGAPQDIEWAICDSQLFLLQSRPITTLQDAETYEALLHDTRQQLRARLEKGRGPWVVHNISETLPHPTPLTWSVIKRFMSGDGGFGAMYREAGFEPSPAVCREGFLELIAGKVYMDASLAPEMFFENYPFRYDVEHLRRDPDAAQSPPTIPTGPLRARFMMARRANRAAAHVRAMAADYDRRFSSLLVPDFEAWVKSQKQIDLQALSTADLVQLWHDREKRVMDDFAPRSLLPSLISAAAIAELRGLLEECCFDDDPEGLTHLLSSGHEPDLTLLANAALYRVAMGAQTAEQWLVQYGHRAPEEFDLSAPRWRQRPDELLAMAARLKDGADPAELHRTHLEKVQGKLDQLSATLHPADLAAIQQKLSMARRYMRYREDGKFYLMLGYDLLRDAALEAGRRLEIGDDVFMLSLEELTDALGVGYAPHHLIEQRKIQRRAQKRISLPYVIEEGNLDQIGAPPKVPGSGAMDAFAISPGAAQGPARIVRSPEQAGDLGRGYVLVCPSTDPSWTPLFTNAAGLILECGGTLSHGAVVAREMSIPAVVLRDACAILHDGQTVSVDGRNGLVIAGNGEIAPSAPAPQYESRTPADTRIDRSMQPPPPGRIARRAARLRNFAAIAWGVFLLAAFLLPESWLYQPSLTALDTIFWPLVRSVGKAWTVAIIAGVMGLLTMLGQKFLSDNARLMIARKRAAACTQEAARYDADSPRSKALKAIAAGVQSRILGAAMVPLGLLLGPMVMTFAWLPARIDPASWSADPGSTVDVIAYVHSDRVKEVKLDLPGALRLDPSTPARQNVPPIRQVLEEYRKNKLKPTELREKVPGWELPELAADYRRQQLADLDEYLSKLPPAPVAWKVNTPNNTGGRWQLYIHSGGFKTPVVTYFDIVLGDSAPPAPTEIAGDNNTELWGSGLVNIKIVYPQTQQHRVLLPALTGLADRWYNLWLGGDHWHTGWLGLYLLAYLPAMFGARWLLGVA